MGRLRGVAKKAQAGFTLLEIMIAITIMTVAFGAILTSQGSSIVLATKTKEVSVAGWLAHDIMIRSEHLMEGKPFGELKTEEAGQFPEPYQKYTWKREVREPKFPDFGQLSQGKEGEPVQEIVLNFAKMITKYLNDSVRELTVTVSWQHAGGEQHIVVSTYLVDLTAEFNFSQ